MTPFKNFQLTVIDTDVHLKTNFRILMSFYIHLVMLNLLNYWVSFWNYINHTDVH